jgi:hypothetical protein
MQLAVAAGVRARAHTLPLTPVALASLSQNKFVRARTHERLCSHKRDAQQEGETVIHVLACFWERGALDFARGVTDPANSH